MELTGEQILTLSLYASGIVQVLAIIWVGLLKQPKPSKGVMRIVAFVMSVFVAYFWSGVELPPLGDPMAFALALITLAGEIFLFAHLIYQVVLQVFLNWLDEKVLARTLLAP